MATLIIKTNASQGTDVLIADLGILIPNSGGSVTFTNPDTIRQCQQSRDLRAYIIDDAHGAGSSTLILNDGSGDIAQADGDDWLESLLLPAAGGAYGVLVGDAAGDFNAGGAFITNLSTAAPTSGGDVATKSYVDSIAVGLSWQEPAAVLHLVGSEDVTTINGLSPTAGDAYVMEDAGTLTAGSLGVAAGDLVEYDGAAWAIIVPNSGGQVPAGTRAIFSTQTALNNTLGTDATDDGKIAEWDGAETGPTDPPNTIQTPSDGWALLIADADSIYANLGYTFNGTVPTGTWIQFTGGATIVGGDGIVKTGNTIAIDLLDAGSGLEFAGGGTDELSVDWETTAGNISGLGAAKSAGSATTVARSDHVHTHDDRGGDGATSMHDADQVDVETGGGFAVLTAPASSQAMFEEIDDYFAGGQLSGKLVQFGTTLGVPGSGTRYLESAGAVVGSSAALRMARAGTLTAASVQFDAALTGGRQYKLSVQINGTEVESVPVASGQGGSLTNFTTTFSAGDLLRVALIRTAGTGGSGFDDAAATVEFVN